MNEGQLRIENALWTIRQGWPEMHAAPAPLVAGSRPVPGSRPPSPLALLADRQRVVTTCRHWAGWVVWRRRICAYPQVDPNDVMSSTAFLLDHAEWLGAVRQAPAAASALEQAARTCEVWARELHVRRIAIAPCPHCAGVLWAILRAEDDTLPSVIRCDLDGHEYPPHGWHSLGRSLSGLHPDGVVRLRRVMSRVDTI